MKNDEVSVNIDPMDWRGIITLNFNETIAWPADVESWTDENFGSIFMIFSYIASEVTLDKLDSSGVSQEFHWKVIDSGQKMLQIKLLFSHDAFVSVDRNDKVSVALLP